MLAPCRCFSLDPRRCSFLNIASEIYVVATQDSSIPINDADYVCHSMDESVLRTRSY